MGRSLRPSPSRRLTSKPWSGALPTTRLGRWELWRGQPAAEVSRQGGAGMQWPGGTLLLQCQLIDPPPAHSPAESPVRGAAAPERQEEERGPPLAPAEGTLAQAIARVETTVPNSTAAPSTAPAPHTTVQSHPATVLGLGADSTGGPETLNRGG